MKLYSCLLSEESFFIRIPRALEFIYMDLTNISCMISIGGDHWERDGSRQKLGHWIIKSADYLQPIKMVILSTELLPMLTQWVVFYIVH